MRDPTRNAAFDLLIAALERRVPLDESLARLPEIEWRDRAAAHRLAATVLRRLGSLDAVLEPHLRKAPPEEVRHILRLGAAGLLLLETPPHAAVGTAVELARERGLTPFAGLVNAVLRRVADSGRAVLDEIDGPRLDTPPWLWASWGADARAIATTHQQPPPLDLSFRNPGFVHPGERLPNGSMRVPNGTRVADLPGFAEGAFWVQDVAATFPVRLLKPRSGERVADLCAAPGGKTAQLVAAGAKVVAVERDPRRAERLRENLRRLRMEREVEIVETDAAEWSSPTIFDAVLLDAPCSATGTIRRHPEILRIKRPRDVRSMTEIQDRLLASLAKRLRRDGRLIYAVCSLQPEEGAPRIERLLRQGGWKLAPFTPAELPEVPEAITPEGYLRTHPGMWAERGGMDGFFAARLFRT